MSWAAVAGAAIGAVGSSMKSDGGSTETKKEPWGPAVPWLTANLKTGQDLQGFYQKNPFSAQQKTGRQNQLSMADQFQGQMMPGLMDFANKGMTSQYQRASGGAPGSGAGYGSSLLGGNTPRPAGLMSSGQGPFSAPKTQAFGLIDWQAQNPFDPGNANGIAGTPAAAAPAADPLAGLTPEQIAQLLQLLNGYGGGGGPGAAGAGGGVGDGAGDGGVGGTGVGGTGTGGSGD